MLLPCPFHSITGLDCPFCGGQRMLIELMHGNILEAFSLNPVLFCLLPYIVVYAISGITKGGRESKIFRWCSQNKVVFTVIGIFVLWGIIRNL